MIVCMCRGISDRKLRAGIERGKFTSVREIARDCGAGSDCGACVNSLKNLVKNPSNSIGDYKQADR